MINFFVLRRIAAIFFVDNLENIHSQVIFTVKHTEPSISKSHQILDLTRPIKERAVAL